MKRLQKQAEFDTNKAIEIHDKIYSELKDAQKYAEELVSMDPENINGWKTTYEQISALVKTFE